MGNSISHTIKTATPAIAPGMMLVVTSEQLAEMVVTLIEQTEQRDEVLDVKGLAALLNISQSHAYTMAQNGEVPALNMRPLRFSKNQVLEYLKNKEQ